MTGTRWLLVASLVLCAQAVGVRAQDARDAGDADEPAAIQTVPPRKAAPKAAAKPDAVVEDASDDAADDAAVRADGDPASSERERWQQRAEKARERVEKAHARVDAALAAYQNMRQRQWPRGDAAQAIVREVSESKKALETAEGKLRKLEDAAEAADVPPAWIEPD